LRDGAASSPVDQTRAIVDGGHSFAPKQRDAIDRACFGLISDERHAQR
jgi:hypothetical protein